MWGKPHTPGRRGKCDFPRLTSATRSHRAQTAQQSADETSAAGVTTDQAVIASDNNIVNPGENADLEINNRAVRLAIENIDNHFQKPLSLSIVADAVGVSASYLSCIFRKETGATYSQFLTQLRMSAAIKYIMENTNIRLAEVAERIGYVNCKHFLKVFKSVYGMTPTEYKKRQLPAAKKH